MYLKRRSRNGKYRIAWRIRYIRTWHSPRQAILTLNAATALVIRQYDEEIFEYKITP